MTRKKVNLSCPTCHSEIHGHSRGITYYLCAGRAYRQKVEGKWVEIVECQGGPMDVLKWNAEQHGDNLYLCKGNHEKTGACEWEKITEDVWKEIIDYIRDLKRQNEKR